jgi:hypothetical protein
MIKPSHCDVTVMSLRSLQKISLTERFSMMIDRNRFFLALRHLCVGCAQRLIEPAQQMFASDNEAN